MRQIVLEDIRSSEADRLLLRPPVMSEATVTAVRKIVDDVRSRGDEAVRSYTAAFDGAVPAELEVTGSEFDEAERLLPSELRRAIAAAAETIRRFHAAQIPTAIDLETAPGVRCRREWRPLSRVGLYIPGGSAPLVSTVLMLGIPAALAGCPEVILCSPPRDAQGGLAPAILHAAKRVGVGRVFKAGGAQAIAAMAAGTATIPRVDKIFGPGNRYVTAAKALVSRDPFNVPVDLVAGPTELLIIADESADPRWVAADLLAQAEHGEDSRVVLVTMDRATAEAVAYECESQLTRLSRRDVIGKVLAESAAVIVPDLAAALAFSDRYAPEHLGLAVRDAGSHVSAVRHAGSVFVGTISSSVFGDYAAGPNHTLPTGGTAASAGGVTVESFMKPLFVQTLSPLGVASLSAAVRALAEAEGLDAHEQAVASREQRP